MNTLFFSSISFGLSLLLSAVADAHTSLFLAFAYVILLPFSYCFKSPVKKNCSIDFSSNVPAAARALRNQGSGRGRTSTLRDMFVCVYMCVRARVMMSHVQLCTIEAIQQIIYESTILFFLVLLNITRLRLNSNLCSKQR